MIQECIDLELMICRLAASHSCGSSGKPFPGTHIRHVVLLYNLTFQHAREAFEQTHRKWIISWVSWFYFDFFP